MWELAVDTNAKGLNQVGLIAIICWWSGSRGTQYSNINVSLPTTNIIAIYMREHQTITIIIIFSGDNVISHILLWFLNAALFLLLLLLSLPILVDRNGIIKRIEKCPMVTTNIHLITTYISLVAVITVGTIYIYVCV